MSSPDQPVAPALPFQSASGGISRSERLIALITPSTQQVREISQLLEQTAFAGHQIVWMPANPSAINSATYPRFDAILLAGNHQSGATQTHSFERPAYPLPEGRITSRDLEQILRLAGLTDNRSSALASLHRSAA